MSTFRALVTSGDGPATFQELTDADLPAGTVTIEVSHSSLNYKDGLSVTGKGRIARSFPMVCGADLAGTVASSDDPAFAVGDEVLVTGWGLSELHPGGYTQRQRVEGGWITRVPEGLTRLQAMAIGTAGLTAMLSVLALEQTGLTPENAGEVLVTGAGGGVGSTSISLLASLGYTVVASTGRTSLHDSLRALGATSFIDRSELSEAGRPLQKERWGAAIDCVGSTTLATVLSQTRYGRAVAACGLAGGNDLPTTVLPFILRGVSLLGIDSVYAPSALRDAAWARLVSDLPLDKLDALTRVEPLSSVNELAQEILRGDIAGRVVIDTAQ